MYAFCLDMRGGTLEHQAALNRLIPDSALSDCVVHVTGEYEGGVRIIDVWVDEAAFHTFQKQHLFPALARVSAEAPTSGLRIPDFARFTPIEVTGDARSGAMPQLSTR
jgi:hypothetical protein